MNKQTNTSVNMLLSL